MKIENEMKIIRVVDCVLLFGSLFAIYLLFDWLHLLNRLFEGI